MALLKSLQGQYGLTANYHAVGQVNIFWGTNITQHAHVDLLGFQSETAKKTSLEPPLIINSFDFLGSDFPFTKGGNNEQEFYVWLKTAIIKELEKPSNERNNKIMQFDGAIDD